MTNVFALLTIIRFITNSGTITVWDNGNGTITREQRYIINAECKVPDTNFSYPIITIPLGVRVKTWTNTTPPIPLIKSQINSTSCPNCQFRSLPPRAIRMSTNQTQVIIVPASIIDPACECRFFQAAFYAHTNHIYSFQRSNDLINWEFRPPAIDGEEGMMAFYDVFENDFSAYRICVVEGVLPP